MENTARSPGFPTHLILKNLARLLQTDQDLLVRMPLIPGVNDDASTLAALGDFLPVHRHGVQLEPMPYHRLGDAKYARLGRSCKMEDIPAPFGKMWIKQLPYSAISE